MVRCTVNHFIRGSAVKEENHFGTDVLSNLNSNPTHSSIFLELNKRTEFSSYDAGSSVVQLTAERLC